MVIAGKGHETTQTFADRTVAFDDRVVRPPQPSREVLGRVIPLLIAGGISLVTSLLGTRYLIDWLTSHRVGQPIQEDGPAGPRHQGGHAHHGRRGLRRRRPRRLRSPPTSGPVWSSPAPA